MATAPRHAIVRPRVSERPDDAWPRLAVPLCPSSVLNFKYSTRVQALQKRFRLRQIEFLVPGFYAQKETIRRSKSKSLDVEGRVVRRRQSVQSEHSEHGREGRTQDRQLECDRNPHGPAIERFAANVQRKADHVCVVAHSETSAAAAQSAEENHEGKSGPIETNRFGQTLDRNGGKRVNAPVTGFACAMRRLEHLLGRLEFSHQTVNGLMVHDANAAPVRR